MAIDTPRPIAGFPEEWGSFFKRHPSWPTVLNNLRQILEKIFIRKGELENPAQKLVFFVGRLCVEDFNEVFLLAANAYGFGSLKLLRGLYERIVTIAYIAKNQDEAIPFLEYHHIQTGRLIHHAESFFGDLEKYIDKSEIAKAKNDFRRYKDNFMQINCRKCETRKIMHSWSKLDLASMAKKTGLEKLYFPGYYYPTLQAHATAAAVMYRLKSPGENCLTFDEGSQREAADRSLIIAHNLIIRLVQIQNEFFNLDLIQELELLISDFDTVWQADLNG